MRDQIIWSHMGKKVHIVVDRPVGYRHGNILYPVNYGYLPEVIAGDGEAQDVYILGVAEPLETFDGYIIGAIRRKDDVEDKLVAAPEGMRFHQAQIAEMVAFQEQYFDSKVIAQFHKSCGVLVYRDENGVREYLLALQIGDNWSVPKGHMEAGETEKETALRELFEETGLTAVLDAGKQATMEYPISLHCRKEVVVFTGRASGTPTPRAGEIETLKWVTADQLQKYLMPDAVRVCRELLELKSQ